MKSYPHGSYLRYVKHGCRCDLCRAADTRVRKRRRYRTKDQAIPLRVNAVGSRRRLQALACLGWTLPELERRAGERPKYYNEMMYAPSKTLDRGRAERISSLYDELWDQEPPQVDEADRFRAAYAKTTARRNGWAPPMAWAGIDMDDPEAQPALDAELDDDEDFDWVKVERVLDGRARASKLNRAEKRQVVLTMTARGVPPWAIAERTGMALRTVLGILAGEQERLAA